MRTDGDLESDFHGGVALSCVARFLMDELTGLSVDEFLTRTAERSPAPGGGSVTALAGALACALARMVAAYSKNAKTAAALASRVEEAVVHLARSEQLLCSLITQDAIAYERMTESARRLKGDPAAAPEHRDAVLAAMAVPMETAAICSHALTAMDEFKDVAGKYLLSDLAIAAILAHATARACGYTVRVNAPSLDDPVLRGKMLTEIDGIDSHCTRRRESIESFVGSKLTADRPDR